MAYASLVSGVEICVGYVSETTAKIAVVSLQGGTPAVTTSHGTAEVSSWTDFGDDNPSREGEVVCAVATVTISGLPAWTKVSGTITCDGITREFSFRTQPSDSTPYNALVWTCERHSDLRYKGSAPWDNLKAMAQDDKHLFCAIIDDVNYTQLMDDIDDATTGLAVTGKPGDTGLEWDYALAWCVWFGLIPSEWSANYDSRLWLHRNSAHWCQWGDNEVNDNHGRQAIRKRRDEDLQGGNAFWDAARDTWYGFIADHMTPPKAASEGGPSSQDDCLWGTVVGPVRFVSPDVNEYITPFDDSGSALGSTQVSDITAWLDNADPFLVYLSPLKVSGHNNEPHSRQSWGTEWEPFVADMIDNAATNESSIVWLAGDSHNTRVVSYHANGSDGLGGSDLASGELWEIGVGTVNGSGAHDSMKGKTYGQGGKMRFEKYAYDSDTYSTRNLVCATCCLMEMKGAEIDFSIIDLSSRTPYSRLWGPATLSQNSNALTYQTPKVGA